MISVIEMGPHLYITALENTTEAYSETLNNSEYRSDNVGLQAA